MIAKFNASPAVARNLQRTALLFALGICGTAMDLQPALAQVDRYDLIRRGGVDSGGVVECRQGQVFCSVNQQGQPIPGSCVDCGSTEPVCPARLIAFLYAPLSAKTCDALGAGARACDVTIGGTSVRGTCSTVGDEEPPESGRTAPCSSVICAPKRAVVGTCSLVGSGCSLIIEGSVRAGTCSATESGEIYCRIS
jgi:hypothetical protein